MSKEYALLGRNFSANIHKTDDIWFMYITGTDKTHQFFDKTKKKLVAIFNYLDENPSKLEQMLN
jgi:hypothetical protein